jgi:hypothetical protein
MNARSSRSHAVFSLRVTQQEAVAGTDGRERRERWSKINLVDLAGSERASKSGAEGGRLKEGIAINVSLSALGNVIIALASAAKGGKRPHVPYRNSKLTRVLQESLGGNSLTVMVSGAREKKRSFHLRHAEPARTDDGIPQLLPFGGGTAIDQCAERKRVGGRCRPAQQGW